MVNRLDRERKVPYDLMEYFFKSPKTKTINSENRLIVGRCGDGEMDEGDQKVQTFSYKIHKTWDVIAWGLWLIIMY